MADKKQNKIHLANNSHVINAIHCYKHWVGGKHTIYRNEITCKTCLKMISKWSEHQFKEHIERTQRQLKSHNIQSQLMRNVEEGKYN